MNRLDQLRARADDALARADVRAGLEALEQLQIEEPQEGLWPRRIADVYRSTGQRAQQQQALMRAADRYAAAGEVMQAIVMCKRMLDLDPKDPEVVSRLGRLHPRLREAGHPKPKIEVRSVPIRAEIEDGVPISEMSIARVLGLESDEAISAIRIISDAEVDRAFDALADTDRATPAEIVGTFPLTPFFAALREDSFRRLIDRLHVRSLSPGDAVFRQGDRGESFFVISDGAVEVQLQQDPPRVLGRLDEGEFFGEIALITDHPRTATVRAVAETTLIEIDRHAVSELIYEDPEVMTVLLWFLRDRLVDTLIRTNPLFERFPYAKRRELTDRFRFLESRHPAVLIEQGQEARGLIIILAGQARVTRDGRELAILGPGELCGEMSLLSAEPAVATVASPGQLFALEISVADFKALAAEHPDVLLAVEAVADSRLPLI